MKAEGKNRRRDLTDAVDFSIRLLLVFLSILVIRLADVQHTTFQEKAMIVSTLDKSRWLSWVGFATLAGFLLGLALRFPEGRARFRLGRVLLPVAVLSILLAYSFMLSFGYWAKLPLLPQRIGRYLRPDPFIMPFLNYGPEFALAMAIGVSIALGFQRTPTLFDSDRDAGRQQQ